MSDGGLRIHAIVGGSQVNGPGSRAVLWVQGCTLACPGCWNPETHSFGAPRDLLEGILERLAALWTHDPSPALTLSGGEPMQQAGAILALLQRIHGRRPGLSVGMFTGYTEEELEAGGYLTSPRLLFGSSERAEQRARHNAWRRIRTHLDFAVMGRYDRTQPIQDALRTSANQQLHLFSGRYSEADFSPLSVEIQIEEGGAAVVTGFPIRGLPA